MQQRDQLIVLRQGRPGEQDDPRPLGPLRDDELHVLDEIRKSPGSGFPDDDSLQRAEGKAAAADVVNDPTRGSRNHCCLPLEPPLLPARIFYFPERHKSGRIADGAGKACERPGNLPHALAVRQNEEGPKRGSCAAERKHERRRNGRAGAGTLGRLGNGIPALQEQRDQTLLNGSERSKTRTPKCLENLVLGWYPCRVHLLLPRVVEWPCGVKEGTA